MHTFDKKRLGLRARRLLTVLLLAGAASTGKAVAQQVVPLIGGKSFVSQYAGTQVTSPAPVPQFKVDPFWPKELPHQYVFGDLGGLAVDSDDHVWVLSRPRTLAKSGILGLGANPPTANCCVPAPAVTEFDNKGNFIQGWGGPGQGYQWPDNEHGIYVDYKGNVWLSGNFKNDNQVLKFTHDGKFLLQIGHAGMSKGSLDTDNTNEASEIFVWQPTNEVFISDGYVNRRVIVFDADTGKFKRMWSAFGNKPDDSVPRTRSFHAPSPQFDLVHGVSISNDGLVYVADRKNNRIQVFTIDGKFVQEAYVAKTTLDGRGTSFGVAFSPDKDQTYLYTPDGANNVVRIFLRKSMQEIGQFGHTGRYAGQWYWLHNIAADHEGNIYTGESQGSRIQKFDYMGLSTHPIIPVSANGPSYSAP